MGGLVGVLRQSQKRGLGHFLGQMCLPQRS